MTPHGLRDRRRWATETAQSLQTVGYGPRSSSKYTTTYFRRAFIVDEPSAYTRLVFQARRDDGIVIYLNGTEVFRNNMPKGTIAYSTRSSSSGSSSSWYATNFLALPLLAQSNMVAVEIHQESAGSSDLFFDLELSGTGDTTPPTTTSDLRITGVTADAMSLSWSAPNEISAAGKAEAYDIRFSTSQISDSNWASATQAVNEPTPGMPGTPQAFTIGGLLPAKRYYVRLRSSDAAGNWSALSSQVNATTLATPPSTNDVSAPAAINNLAVSSVTSNSVALLWTSPGDDGSSGTAAAYDLRYSTGVINAASWLTSVLADGEPTPSSAGNSQAMTVRSLNPATTYFFAIKSVDEVGNISPLSNIPGALTAGGGTTPAPTICSLGAVQFGNIMTRAPTSALRGANRFSMIRRGHLGRGYWDLMPTKQRRSATDLIPTRNLSRRIFGIVLP